MPRDMPALNAAKSEPRKRASLACQNCRQRKVKCDAQRIQPGQRCTPCQRMNSNCTFSRDGDRRKSGSRKHVETLEQRIHSLESLLSQGPNQPAKTGEDPARPIRNMSPVQEVPEEIDQLPTTQTEASIANESHNVTADVQHSSRNSISPTGMTWLGSDLDVSPLLALDRDHSEPACDTDIDTLGGGMPRAGSISDGGRELEPSSHRSSRSPEEWSCALGPTSQPHLLSPVVQQPISAPDELSDLGITMDIDSVQLRSRLLQSFFRYQTLWISVIDEQLFNSHKKSGVSSFWYSPFLETVMLACAARLSTSSAVRSLGHKYASQSSFNIIHAIEKPSAASLQGFLLLSEYEVTHGRDRIGWMLCGMASRMLVDIGLHDPAHLKYEPRSTDSQAPLLHLFCATISYEGIWCMYLGRPSAIPRSIVKAAAIGCRNYNGNEAAILTAWMELCVPMAEICDILNSAPCLEPKAWAALSTLDANIRKWCNKLPPEMAYDETCIPGLDPTAYGIHMQFCKVQILIHNAFIKASATRPWESIQLSAETCVFENRESEQIIYKNAIQIIRLLLTYRQIQGTEKIPSVMLDNVNLALTVLITEFVKHPTLITTHSRDIQWLRLAINTMDSLQSHFPIITRMLCTLQPMLDGTPLADLVSSNLPSQPTRKSATPPGDTRLTPVAQNCREAENATTSRQLGISDKFSSFLQMGGTDNAHGGERSTEQFPSLNRHWLHQDPEEFTSSLLSWPNLQLASLWMPQPTTAPREANV